ncbi:MAG TPA: FCD domain-containing protein, partial [Limnochordia bacterium]|nr:FCD domain-containing protein [Limnochordia bacterium]
NLTILRVRAWTLRRNKSLDAGLSEHRAIYARLAAGDWDGAKQLLLDANDELFAAVQKMRATEPNWFAVVEPVATLQH